MSRAVVTDPSPLPSPRRTGERESKGAPPSADVPTDRRELDAVKGLLVLFIVVGHARLLTKNWFELYHGLYLFHVFAFLFLPFLAPAKPLSGREVLDRACRYLVPYAACVVLLAPAWLLLSRRHEPLQWAADVAMALPAGSARLLDRATGFQAYWFLPALLSVTLARDALAAAPRAAFWVGLALLCAAHGLIGMLPDGVKELTPMGLFIAAYVLPLGLLCRWAWVDRGLASAVRRADAPTLAPLWLLALVVLAMPFFALYARNAGRVNIGYLMLHTYAHPLRLAWHDVLAVAPFLSVLVLSPLLARVPGLATVGRHSLVVYLAHSPLYQAVAMAAKAAGLDQSRGMEIAVGLAAVAFAVAASMGLAALLDALPALRRLLLPRSADEWPPARWVAGQ